MTTQTDTGRRAYSTQEIAAMLGVCAHTITKRCRSGELPGIRIGTVWRIKVEDFDAWLDSHSTGGNAS